MNQFNFSLTQKEADIVINSLVKQPYEVSAGVINTMQSQFKEQAEKQEKKPEK